MSGLAEFCQLMAESYCYEQQYKDSLKEKTEDPRLTPNEKQDVKRVNRSLTGLFNQVMIDKR
ncbi:MAG: hypothetical protein ACOYK9_01315 [Chlamydiia bacterium]